MNKIRTFVIFQILVLAADAQTKIFGGIDFKDNLKNVLTKVEAICDSTRLVDVESPVFPLAVNDETHLLAFGLESAHGLIEKISFIFSDGKLTYIECKGNVLQTLLPGRGDSPQNYLEYSVYLNDLLFIDVDQDEAWFLTAESVHPNLFMWNNPLLNKQELKYNPSAKLPDFITMGHDLESLEPLFAKESKILEKVTLDGSDPNAQIQLNAFGIEYAGFPRKFEARFGDGKLNTLWILTGKGEEERIRQRLIAEYGQPVFINDQWEFFGDWTLALRKDIPEVLFQSASQALVYKKSLEK